MYIPTVHTSIKTTPTTLTIHQLHSFEEAGVNLRHNKTLLFIKLINLFFFYLSMYSFAYLFVNYLFICLFVCFYLFISQSS